jgi:hypothetical protein
LTSISNGQHRGPVAGVILKPEVLARERGRRLDGKKGDLTEAEKLEEKRRKAREYYHAHRDRALAQKKAKYVRAKNLPVVASEGPPPTTVPKRPSKVDALVAVNRSVRFAQQGDIDGAELWARFAARIIEGKE